MRVAWNKGQSKESHPSVRKISRTMRTRGIDNFAPWREQAKRAGLLKSKYPSFRKNGDLAELIGMILGDGHIGVFPRTESLRVVCNSSNPGLIQRVAGLIEKVLRKRPHIGKRSNSNAVNITIYEKNLSVRFSIPKGSRGKLTITVPGWILQKRSYRIRFLRGLYEAEGSYNVHAPTYTYKMMFSNMNGSLLDIVLKLVKGLGFHPHISGHKLQISRKKEVQKFKNLIQFRRY